jgi:hypothetical protein
MSTNDLTAKHKARIVAVVFVVLALVIATGLLLREQGPGSMGTGFLWGAALALVGACLSLWRVSTNPNDATTLERAWTQAGDERDDAVLTRALAILGLVAVPLTGAAAIAIGLGAHVAMVLALLLFGELAVGALAFAIINRGS